MPDILKLGLVASRFAVAIALLIFACDWRSPLLADVRYPLLVGILAFALTLIVIELWTLRRAHRSRLLWVLTGTSLLVSAAVLVVTVTLEVRFRWMRHGVLQADQSRLEKLGRHVIVGYRNFDELRGLVERRAVAGIFITARNVRNRDADAIRREIAVLQNIRSQQGLSPLLVATDQEGGIISRLSPPLPRLPSLGEIVRNHPDPVERENAVRQNAREQGRALAGIGINLNFAPVVDLNHSVVSPTDRHTLIYLRAISDNAQIVTKVAGHYCQAMNEAGVQCTLKHFPGLGRVIGDTHLEHASLNTPRAMLEQTDWIPFRALMQSDGVFTMLAHVNLNAVDPAKPASFSATVIANLLRTEWKYNGVLVTDDFGMEAVYGSRGGLAAASVLALNAGVDLILVAYDPDVYVAVMHALLRADAEGRLDNNELRNSDRRLTAATIPRVTEAVSAD